MSCSLTAWPSLLAAAWACAAGTTRNHTLAKRNTALTILLIEILFNFSGIFRFLPATLPESISLRKNVESPTILYSAVARYSCQKCQCGEITVSPVLGMEMAFAVGRLEKKQSSYGKQYRPTCKELQPVVSHMRLDLSLYLLSPL